MLKALQKRLSNILYLCADEIVAKKDSDTPNRKLVSLSHGFKKKHSIATNAKPHRNKRYVLNIDLDNFFPSINFGRVRGFFIKNRDFQLNQDIATIIAQIACHNNQLPQGSPCSPIISNFIAQVLDVRLVQLARKWHCTYSRYADDITFSTNLKLFPSEIAIKQNDGKDRWTAGIELDTIIRRTGFNINHSKTRMQYKDSRQVVTGLVVNRKVNVISEYYRLARAMSHSLFTTGRYFLPPRQEEGKLAQLRGIFSHIYHIKSFDKSKADNAYHNNKKPLTTAIGKLYNRFLYYQYFHALDMPLIICEGDTDFIYLKCALRNLYPNNNHEIIQFFNYSRTNADILYLSGGNGPLSTFIKSYKKNMEPFKCLGQRHPVIIVVDNDSGGVSVINAAKSVTKHSPNQNNESYFFINNNLYLLPIPKIGENGTKIEDYFKPETRATMINGKKFNDSNTRSDDGEYYGKKIFAEQVIKRNQAAIDFGDFQAIFDLIFAIIREYRILFGSK